MYMCTHAHPSLTVLLFAYVPLSIVVMVVWYMFLCPPLCMCVFLQEDIESMQKELEGWRKENADHSEALRREERCAQDWSATAFTLTYIWNMHTVPTM